MSDDKPSKAEQLVAMNKERRARGAKEKQAEAVSLLISKDRAIRTEPVSARKDPDLRAKQLQEKKEEETRRLAKIAKDKIFNREVAEKKALAEANRQKAAADKEEAILNDESTGEIVLTPAKIPNTATPAAQKLADEHDPPILISELRAGADNRIQLSEVKAAIKAISGE